MTRNGGAQMQRAGAQTASGTGAAGRRRTGIAAAGSLQSDVAAMTRGALTAG